MTKTNTIQFNFDHTNLRFQFQRSSKLFGQLIQVQTNANLNNVGKTNFML